MRLGRKGRWIGAGAVVAAVGVGAWLFLVGPGAGEPPPLAFAGAYPGMSVDEFRQLAFFPRCKRHPHLEKLWTTPEVWFCIAPTAEAPLAVAELTLGRLARLQVYFGAKPLTLPVDSAEEQGSPGSTILGEATLISTQHNDDPTALAHLHRSLGPAKRTLAHVDGLNGFAGRDTLCEKGTNALQCVIELYQAGDIVGVLGTNFGADRGKGRTDRRVAGQLVLEHKGLTEILGDH